MTDNEIIQVLKNHIEAEDCVNCESFGKCDEFLLTEKVLDLITRQQAEIERLKEEHDKNFEKWILLSDKTKQHYAELYDEAKEIVKSEAIKEFAMRLKCGVPQEYGVIRCQDVDNLVKEMEGERK